MTLSRRHVFQLGAGLTAAVISRGALAQATAAMMSFSFTRTPT
jgi:hypothetical protein